MIRILDTVAITAILIAGAVGLSIWLAWGYPRITIAVASTSLFALTWAITFFIVGV